MEDNYRVSIDMADLQSQLQQVQGMMQQTMASGNYAASAAGTTMGSMASVAAGSVAGLMPNYVPPMHPGDRWLPNWEAKTPMATVAATFGWGHDPNMSISYGDYREKAKEEFQYKSLELAGDLVGSAVGGTVAGGLVAASAATTGGLFASAAMGGALGSFAGPAGWAVGAAATLAGGYLGGKAVDLYEGTLGYDAANARNIKHYVRDTSWRSLGGRMSEADADKLAGEMSTVQRDSSLVGQRMNSSDVQRLIGEYTEAGAFNYVKSAEEYAQKMKDLVKSHKDVMHILRVSEKEAVAAFMAAPTAGAAANIAGMAFNSGLSSSELMQMGSQSMESVRGSGMNLGSAFQHGMADYGYIRNLQKEDSAMMNVVANLGGTQGAAMAMAQIGNQWAMSDQGFLTMSAGLNPNMGLFENIGAAINNNSTPGQFMANMGAQTRIAGAMGDSEKTLYAARGILQNMEMFSDIVPISEDTFAATAKKQGYSDPQARLMWAMSVTKANPMDNAMKEISMARMQEAHAAERGWWDVTVDSVSNAIANTFGSFHATGTKSWSEDFLEGERKTAYVGTHVVDFLKENNVDERYKAYGKLFGGEDGQEWSPTNLVNVSKDYKKTEVGKYLNTYKDTTNKTTADIFKEIVGNVAWSNEKPTVTAALTANPALAKRLADMSNVTEQSAIGLLSSNSLQGENVYDPKKTATDNIEGFLKQATDDRYTKLAEWTSMSEMMGTVKGYAEIEQNLARTHDKKSVQNIMFQLKAFDKNRETQKAAVLNEGLQEFKNTVSKETTDTDIVQIMRDGSGNAFKTMQDFPTFIQANTSAAALSSTLDNLKKTGKYTTSGLLGIKNAIVVTSVKSHETENPEATFIRRLTGTGNSLQAYTDLLEQLGKGNAPELAKKAIENLGYSPEYTANTLAGGFRAVQGLAIKDSEGHFKSVNIGAAHRMVGQMLATGGAFEDDKIELDRLATDVLADRSKRGTSEYKIATEIKASRDGKTGLNTTATSTQILEDIQLAGDTIFKKVGDRITGKAVAMTFDEARHINTDSKLGIGQRAHDYATSNATDVAKQFAEHEWNAGRGERQQTDFSIGIDRIWGNPNKMGGLRDLVAAVGSTWKPIFNIARWAHDAVSGDTGVTDFIYAGSSKKDGNLDETWDALLTESKTASGLKAIDARYREAGSVYTTEKIASIHEILKSENVKNNNLQQQREYIAHSLAGSEFTKDRQSIFKAAERMVADTNNTYTPTQLEGAKAVLEKDAKTGEYLFNNETKVPDILKKVEQSGARPLILATNRSIDNVVKMNAWGIADVVRDHKGLADSSYIKQDEAQRMGMIQQQISGILQRAHVTGDNTEAGMQQAMASLQLDSSKQMYDLFLHTMVPTLNGYAIQVVSGKIDRSNYSGTATELK